MNISDSGAKMGNLPPMMSEGGYSGAKMGSLPPMMSEDGYLGAKVGDLPPDDVGEWIFGGENG